MPHKPPQTYEGETIGSTKRIGVTFIVLVVLLAIAGTLSLVAMVLPGTSEEAVAEPSASESSESSSESSDFSAESLPEPSPESPDPESQAAEMQARADDVMNTRAEGIVAMGELYVNGAPVDIEQMNAIVAARGDYRQAAEFVNQNEVLPSGCEIVSLAVAMQAEGLDASPVDIADHYLKTGNNIATEYRGSAHTNGGGLPPCIVDAANAWIEANGASAHAYDLSGSSFEALIQLMNLGYPIVVWTTEELDEPEFVRDVIDGYQWYVSEHCVVLYGAQGDDVLVANSLQGLNRYDRQQFGHIYEACHRYAMFVLPQ